MASQERSAIDDMIAEAKANVGSSSSSEPSGSGESTSSESEGVSITRHTSDHIQGQAKSGADLIGKKINIEGERYSVKRQAVSQSRETETLVLERTIEVDVEITHMSDLGYESPDDVQYSGSEREFAGIHLKESVGDITRIATVGPDGELKEKLIRVLGVNWEDPEIINIKVLYESGEELEKQIDRDLLIESYLLYHEWQGDFVPDADCEDEVSRDILDDMEASGIDVNGMPDIVKEIIKDITDDADEVHAEEIDISDLPEGLRDLIGGFTEVKESKKSKQTPEPTEDPIDEIFESIFGDRKRRKEQSKRPDSKELLGHLMKILEELAERK